MELIALLWGIVGRPTFRS